MILFLVPVGQFAHQTFQYVRSLLFIIIIICADGDNNVRGSFLDSDGFFVPAGHGINCILSGLVRKPFPFLEMANGLFKGGIALNPVCVLEYKGPASVRNAGHPWDKNSGSSYHGLFQDPAFDGNRFMVAADVSDSLFSWLLFFLYERRGKILRYFNLCCWLGLDVDRPGRPVWY